RQEKVSGASMTMTKKILLSLLLLFLMFVNLAALAFAAFPLVRILSGDAIRLGLRLVAEPGQSISDADKERAITVIRSRLEMLGLSAYKVEPSSIQGEDIEVRLPPLDDPERVKELITAFGHFELRLVAKGTEIPYPPREAAEAAMKTQSGGPYE